MHGGGTRFEDIVDVLKSYQADIVTLQEYRHGKNHSHFQTALADMGYRSIVAPPTQSARENSVLLASKFEMTGEGFPLGSSAPYRAVQAKISVDDRESINVICLHFPHKKAQLPLFTSLQQLPENWLTEKSILVGDFNCGIPFVDSETRSFYATHLFQQLLSDGWIDCWRSRYGDAREFTWYSTQRSNGFRYDHALLSKALDQTVARVGYDHDVRIKKISDHSLMILDLK